MKLHNKLIIFLFMVSLTSVALISTLSYRLAKSEAEKRIQDQLETVADRQLLRVNFLLQNMRQDITTLSTMVELRIVLSEYLETTSTSSAQTLRKIISTHQSNGTGLHHVSIVAIDGKVLFSSDRTDEHVTFPHMDLVLGTEDGNKFVLIQGKDPSLFLSDRIQIGTRTLGHVIIESGLDELNVIMKDYSNLGQTGETELAEEDQKGFMFITPLRFGNTSVTRKISLEDSSSPVVIGSSQKNVFIPSAVDYRGKFVFATTRYVDLSDWILVVKIDRDEAFSSITDLRHDLILISLGALGYILLVALFFSRMITAPIVKLTRFSQKISEGDFKERTEINSTDEIGVLARSFNKMAGQLETAFKSLEEKVQERTKELEQKTAELEVRNVDLERFNSMAVDRELKMIELKEKINALEKELGRDSRATESR